MNEADFATQVYDLLSRFGWHWCHFRPGRTLHGWHTALTGDPGFPDVIAIRYEETLDILVAPKYRLVFIELKSDLGKVTEAQEEWLVLLKAAGAEVYLWRPNATGLEAMVEILR